MSNSYTTNIVVTVSFSFLTIHSNEFFYEVRFISKNWFYTF